jgi:hypothetical protein
MINIFDQTKSRQRFDKIVRRHGTCDWEKCTFETQIFKLTESAESKVGMRSIKLYV